MAAKLRAQAPAATLVMVMCLLVLAVTIASARPLTLSEKDGARAVEPPVGDDIQTVVGTMEHDGGAGSPGHKFINIDMLGGVKNSGPSPGAGH